MQIFKKLSMLVLCLCIGVSSCLLFACGKGEYDIKINEVTHSIFYAPLYAAMNLGYFEDEGLNVTLESNDGSHTSMSVLLSGNCEVALVGPETVVYTNEKNDKPLVFGQLTQKDGSFIVSKDQIGKFDLDMLKGKTIIGGRNGGLPAMTLQYILEVVKGYDVVVNKKAGEFTEDQINLRDDVQFANIASTFKASGNEFCTLFEPTASNIEKEGSGYVVSSVGAHIDYVPYTCFVAKESYLKANPERAEKFLRAVYKGYQYVTQKGNSQNAAKALQPSFTGMSLEELQTAVEKYTAIDAWCSNPAMTQESFDRLVKIIKNATKKTYSATFASSVDNTYANSMLEKLTQSAD